MEERKVTHAELISSIKNFVNCINITRGNEMYMVRRYIFLLITKIYKIIILIIVIFMCIF